MNCAQLAELAVNHKRSARLRIVREDVGQRIVGPRTALTTALAAAMHGWRWLPDLQAQPQSMTQSKMEEEHRAAALEDRSRRQVRMITVASDVSVSSVTSTAHSSRGSSTARPPSDSAISRSSRCTADAAWGTTVPQGVIDWIEYHLTTCGDNPSCRAQGHGGALFVALLN